MTTQKAFGGWRKSSYSDTGNGCVELERTLSAVRDSKHPGGPTLMVDVRQLVRAVKGELVG